MGKRRRQIIRIDEAKCNGCGQCVPACKEGALRIVDGKARLVSEVFCDGLGACLGECPTGALTIETREAEGFDEDAVLQQRAVRPELVEGRAVRASIRSARTGEGEKLPCGCPGTMAKTIAPKSAAAPAARGGRQRSELRQWPVQLHLVPANAPYLNGSDLVLLADCTAVAAANLHQDFIRGRVIAMACPKLDDAEPYVEKLAAMIAEGGLRSVEVVMMEVPCCAGLGEIVRRAVERSGVDVPVQRTILSLEGEII